MLNTVMMEKISGLLKGGLFCWGAKEIGNVGK